MNNKKKVFSGLFFILVMGLTIYTFLGGQNLSDIASSISKMNILCLGFAVTLGLIFVALEGVMIFYVLHSMGEKTSIFRCISYSFIGFFYSGITPSATGGQPMQLYYMNKDGRKTSNSTVTLMAVAVMYKLVLVLIGLILLLVWNRGLQQFLGNYFFLYIVGLLLNVILVIFILAVMIFPVMITRTGLFFIDKFSNTRLVKDADKTKKKWYSFVDGYGEAVEFLKSHKVIILNLLIITLIQRCSVFLVTFMVYIGFGLNTFGMASVMALQASVYIAVDMLPIPGAQGITEMMYKSVFATVFPTALLTPSMLVSRTINFYFPVLVSLIVVGLQRIYKLKEKRHN